MSAITTHVLDTARGRPAAGVPVILERLDETGRAQPVGRGSTDDDGRLRTLLPPDTELAGGTYRIRFDTRTWFEQAGIVAFYPEVVVTFEVTEPEQHHHVPLLLSPFGYTTYRGS